MQCCDDTLQKESAPPTGCTSARRKMHKLAKMEALHPLVYPFRGRG